MTQTWTKVAQNRPRILNMKYEVLSHSVWTTDSIAPVGAPLRCLSLALFFTVALLDCTVYGKNCTESLMSKIMHILISIVCF